jgi:hypothetical protein
MLTFDISELEIKKGYWYLGTPYSKWAHGINDANHVAQKLTGALFLAHVPTFSPIAHTHGIALEAGIDPFSHKIFMPLGKWMVDAAYGLLVAELPGWQDSYGLQMEIKWFRDQKKPHFLLNPEKLTYRPVPR